MTHASPNSSDYQVFVTSLIAQVLFVSAQAKILTCFSQFTRNMVTTWLLLLFVLVVFGLCKHYLCSTQLSQYLNSDAPRNFHSFLSSIPFFFYLVDLINAITSPISHHWSTRTFLPLCSLSLAQPSSNVRQWSGEHQSCALTLFKLLCRGLSLALKEGLMLSTPSLSTLFWGGVS